jgi:DNA repair exonuclease SbcCD nuclease subunit
LHLDSPFSGLRRVDGEIAALLKDATFHAFDAVVDLALNNQVDFILVAGDVYDAADRSLRAQLKFAAGLKRLADAGIRSFICHGNHDPLDGWSASLRWPDGVHIFSSRLESTPVTVRGEDVVRIHGISYPDSRIDDSFGKGFHRQGQEPFQIGLLHCSVGSDPAHETYAPRTLADLLEGNLDYWALGHVHTQKVLMDSHPVIAYPGNTQGRHIREAGPRGCLLVQVDSEGQVKARFEAVDAARWLAGELNINDLETEGDLIEALENLCEEFRIEAQGRPAIIRVILKGRGSMHSILSRPQVVDDLTERLRETGREGTPPVWVERVQVQTSTAIDLASRRESADFLGEVLRIVENYRCQPEQLSELIGGLYEDRRGRRFLESPGESDLLEILADVENMCVDELMQEETE